MAKVVVTAAVMAVATVVAVGASPAGGWSPSAHASSPACPGLAVHEVTSGDTWFAIAQATGVSMRALFEVNDASADVMLHPGDTVCLPAGADPASTCTPVNAPTYTVQPADTWWEIADRVGVSMSRLLTINSASPERAIHPGQQICLPMGTSAPDRGARARSSTRSVAAAAPRSIGGIEALPMQGPCWFTDSWGDPRGSGRVHEGVDLFAAPRSYVYAVVDGTLSRRAWDQPGRRAGNAWWLTAADGSGTYYFYGHLADFAPDLEVGSRVAAGEIIGFMGNTGNSAFPHLHFEIHPNGGGAVNPYPMMREFGGCKTGTGYRQPNGWVPD